MSVTMRPDAIDPRLVLQAYGWIAGLASFGLIVGGPRWLAAPPFEPSAEGSGMRLLGGAIGAAACCAAGLASADSFVARRRGLGWFALAHVVVYIAVLADLRVIRSWTLGSQSAMLVLVLLVVLWYLWRTAEGDTTSIYPFEYQKQPVVALFSPSGMPLPESSMQDEPHPDAARQEERNRLARDLHDSIKQQIFVIQTAAATAEARLATDMTGARQAVDQVRASAREAMVEMEAMLDQLRAVPLGTSGLVESLRRQTEALGFRTGARVMLDIGTLPRDEALPAGADQAIFRVAQEALANVGRHARATHVTVSLAAGAESLVLTVADDGVGYDVQQANRGMGQANMRSRADEMGGRLQITSGTSGTTVTLTVPLVTQTLAAFRREARIRAAYAGVIAATAAIGLWLGGLDGGAIIIGIALVALARNLVGYHKARAVAQ